MEDRMTLREFIKHEINLDTISCFEDFRSSLRELTLRDGGWKPFGVEE